MGVKCFRFSHFISWGLCSL